MIKSNNLESIIRLLTFIFIFSGIMAFSLIPYRVFASESINSVIDAEVEEIATFDEDEEATFDPEPSANVSSLLHGDYYQPPVYYPERQKRSVTSHIWMRIILFAALAMLALATTRFFGRRRQKPGLAVQSDEGTCV